jgi:DNA mismatch repair protein MutS2
MDEHALRVLEFDKVLARLARLTAFSAGHDLALALRPSPHYETVLARQRLHAEAVRLRSFSTPISLSGAVDVRPALAKARLDGTLDTQELLDVASTQRTAQLARANLSRAAASLPLLGKLGAALHERPDVVDEVARAISPRGEVLDAASQALAVIRRDIKVAHDRLHAKLQAFLGSAAGKLAAQESIVTLRDGRYVVPIKADFRGEVRGIVHDVSASGATVFIEPLAVVELANTWRELQIEETREVERVLRRLSGIVGAAADDLTANVERLAELDLLMASASLGEELATGGLPCLPETDAETGPEAWVTPAPAALDLREARHPLLTAPVPVSLRIGDQNHVILISGPNTGGKTVALKTVGLLCLMAQAGLPVAAAPGSVLPVYEDVLADIGDEQSIEQSLSTFSGHLKNVIALLERAGPKSLVLLDELAAGTDPTEGAALARALLQHLLDAGATTVATTHHGELKLFAHSTPGVINAAVEFDMATLAPTYKITVGVPGRSNALAIAARLGLPEELLRAAQASIAPDDVAIDSLLDELRSERDAAAEERRGEAQARRSAEQTKSRVEERLASIDAERAERLDEAALALEAEVEAAREALGQVQRLAQRRPAETSTEDVTAAREGIAAASETAKRLRKRSRRRRNAGAPKPEQITPGATVWLQGVPMAAEALSAPDRRGEVDVTFGGLRARVSLGQVVRVQPPSQRPPERSSLPPPPSYAAEEIEVRGQTLDEALPKVEQFLDAGFRAGVPRLRVIHGKGTGKMRNAVRAMLAKHPLVQSYDFADPHEGGEGVTVVEMSP